MDTSFITQWFSEPVVRVFCWMLLHSLWIGLITAGLAGAALMSTQKTTARLRYRLLCGTILVFVGLTGFVWHREWTMRSLNPSSDNALVVGPDSRPMAPFRDILSVDGLSLTDQVKSLIDREFGWIFGVWLVFFVLKSLKLMSGLYQVYRIRYRNIHPLNDDWTKKVALFSQTLGIKRTVTLLQSGLVHIPTTVGWLKPIILLPIGLVFQLPPQQIDAILWHELAHIWRRDYLINLMQHLLEAVFFFNPGLLWLSSLIREEREVCCDELVLAHTASKTQYVEALLAFQDMQPTSALTLGLGTHPLVNRLKRIVTQENKRLRVGEKMMLLAGFVLISAFSMIHSDPPEATPNEIFTNKPTKKTVASRTKPPVAQATPAGRTLTTLPKPNDKAANDTLPVSARPMRADEAIRQFTSIRFVNNNHDQANREMFVQDDKANRYHLLIADSQLVALSVNDVAIPASELAQYISLLAQIDRVVAERRRFKQERITASIAREKDERQAYLQQLTEAYQRKLDNRPGPGSSQKPVVNGHDKPVLPELAKLKPTPTEPLVPTLKTKGLAGVKADTVATNLSWKPKKRLQQPDNTVDRQRILTMLTALVEHNVVANASAVDWFGLSDTELVVNGVRQSNALHQQLKTQLGIRPDYGLYYGPIQMIGKGIIFDKSDL